MNLIATILVIAANSASGIEPEASPVTEQDACMAVQKSQCNAAYEQAGRQCSRYYLKETEAFSLCHETALKRRDICINRGESNCPDEKPGEAPGNNPVNSQQ